MAAIDVSSMRSAVRCRATLVGFGAILLWVLLALFTTGAVDRVGAPLPPFQLVAMTFGIAFLAVLLRALWPGRRATTPANRFNDLLGNDS